MVNYNLGIIIIVIFFIYINIMHTAATSMDEYTNAISDALTARDTKALEILRSSPLYAPIQVVSPWFSRFRYFAYDLEIPDYITISSMTEPLNRAHIRTIVYCASQSLLEYLLTVPEFTQITIDHLSVRFNNILLIPSHLMNRITRPSQALYKCFSAHPFFFPSISASYLLRHHVDAVDTDVIGACGDSMDKVRLLCLYINLSSWTDAITKDTAIHALASNPRTLPHVYKYVLTQ